jgi:uncharacterized protein (TIGR03435 family)
MRTLPAIAALLLATPLLAPPVPAQSPTFIAADIHPNTHHDYHYVNGGDLTAGRYTLTDATMLDLIATAYAVDPNRVLGGPAWLELDRYDIDAKAPRATSPETLRLMLQNLLATRFHLALRAASSPSPAFILSLGSSPHKLKPAADTNAPAACDNKSPQPVYTPGVPFVPPPFALRSCHNMTSADLAQFLQRRLSQNLPVVDSTNLKGAWDFDLKLPAYATPGSAAITLADAVAQQLGLKLAPGFTPLPVLTVVSVAELPTPNPPGTAEALPPPPTEFEVATVKPSQPGAQWRGLVHNNRVDAQGASLGLLVELAYGVNQYMLANPPGWFDSDHFDIVAKPLIQPGTNPQPLNDENVRPMMQALLADRFHLKAHMEDRPADAYVLTAPKPRLQKADPTRRSKCWQARGAATPSQPLADLLTCQNITLTQFADQLSNLNQIEFAIPVLDSTNLAGAYDFTVTYGTSYSADNLPHNPAAPGEASDPSGTLSLFDALNKQLGLKLEKQKRPVPILVIDHIDRTPTPN